MCYPKVNWHPKEITLQHNLRSNLLAIMSTGRQIYDEARRTFYSRNNFRFKYFDVVPVFIAGIGSDNAKLLRSVSWWNDKYEYQNYTDDIQSWLMHADLSGQIPSLELQTKRIKGVHLPSKNVKDYHVAGCDFDKFGWVVRPVIRDNTFSPKRQRFQLRVDLRKNKKAQPRATKVGFELC